MNIGQTKKRIEILIYDGFEILEAILPLAVFDHANVILKQKGGQPGYEVSFAANSKRKIKSNTGIELDATHEIPSAQDVDSIIVVGARDIDHAISSQRPIINWIRESCHRIRRVASLCTGSFLLAEAGLLNHTRATTHWCRAKEMQERYPLVEVDMNPILICDGNIYTAAGGSSGTDLALRFVEEDFGREIALAVAHDLVVSLNRTTEISQLGIALSSQMSSDPILRDQQAQILSNLNKPNHLSAFAGVIGLVPDQAQEAFLRHTGVPIERFIETARLELADSLLEHSEEALTTIAERVGFSDVNDLDECFQKNYGVTASERRKRHSQRLNNRQASSMLH